MYDMDISSGDGLTHLYYSKGDELWPFGFGLSYTSFSYDWSAATATRIDDAAPITTADLVAATGQGPIGYECTVKNTGTVAGDAVVLGFANSTDPQFPREKLFDFERIALGPGESMTVLLTVTAEALSVVEEDGRRWLRASSFMVLIGDKLTPAVHTFEVTGDDVLLDDTSRLY